MPQLTALTSHSAATSPTTRISNRISGSATRRPVKAKPRSVLCDSAYDTKLAVYRSCRCGAGLGNLLACNDDSCGLQSEVSFEVHEDWGYAIRIGGYEGAQGDGQLTVTCINKPACCLPDGTCDELWPEDCTAGGGVVQDARVTCDLITCPSAWQACCQRGGSCEDMAPETCWDQFGFPQGDGTTCTRRLALNRRPVAMTTVRA